MTTKIRMPVKNTNPSDQGRKFNKCSGKGLRIATDWRHLQISNCTCQIIELADTELDTHDRFSIQATEYYYSSSVMYKRFQPETTSRAFYKSTKQQSK